MPMQEYSCKQLYEQGKHRESEVIVCRDCDCRCVCVHALLLVDETAMSVVSVSADVCIQVDAAHVAQQAHVPGQSSMTQQSLNSPGPAGTNT